jgi:hypothetical protein
MEFWGESPYKRLICTLLDTIIKPLYYHLSRF